MSNDFVLNCTILSVIEMFQLLKDTENNVKHTCSTGRLHSPITYIDIFDPYYYDYILGIKSHVKLFPIQNTRGWNQGHLCLEPKSTW